MTRDRRIERTFTHEIPILAQCLSYKSKLHEQNHSRTRTSSIIVVSYA